jgi:glycosyltransferase involved in cell wall biosynthesis
MTQMWEAEFLFALRNRTGKYYHGRDFIESQVDRLAAVRYGRFRSARVPQGRLARALAVAAEREIALRMRRPGLGGRIRRPRPVVHLDPSTVLMYELGPRDAVLCHDLGPITHPDLFDPVVETLYEAAYRRIAACGPAMVFVSQASRDAYAARYGSVPVMRVVYPPLRPELSSAAPDPVPGVRPPFLLTVGSLGRRKNQARTIAAFAASGLAAEGWSYVLCGPREPGAEDVLAAAHGTAGVHALSFVSDGALAWLYRNAAGFVLASRLEGFGVPVAEAIAAGLLPIVTRDSVLEEVAGDGALAVDPFDPADIAGGFTALAAMSGEERARRGAQLRRSIARFTPEAFRSGWSQVLSRAAPA